MTRWPSHRVPIADAPRKRNDAAHLPRNRNPKTKHSRASARSPAASGGGAGGGWGTRSPRRRRRRRRSTTSTTSRPRTTSCSSRSSAAAASSSPSAASTPRGCSSSRSTSRAPAPPSPPRFGVWKSRFEICGCWFWQEHERRLERIRNAFEGLEGSHVWPFQVRIACCGIHRILPVLYELAQSVVAL